MEEWVGQWWHKAITRIAAAPPNAERVLLADVQRSIALLYRAGGGDPAVRVAPAAASRHGGARRFLERMAGSNQRSAQSRLDPEVLALPPEIGVFDQHALNHDLYLWLAALAAVFEPTGDWIADNRAASSRALQRFAGLRSRHAALVQAHLAQRPALSSLRAAAMPFEAAVQAALRGEDHGALFVQPEQVAPVWLWLAADAPTQVEATPVSTHTAGDGPDPDTEPDPNAQGEASKRRRRAKRANAQAAADDMDTLTLARGKQTTASRVKFDLDLPSASADDRPLGPGRKTPEWDWRRRALLPDHCAVQCLVTQPQAPFVPPPHLRATAHRVRRRLEVLRAAPRNIKAQQSGDELDLDAWVRFQTEARGGVQHSDAPPIYTRRERGERSLATLLLADLSLSTDAYATSDARVIDVIRDALYVFGEALAATGDAFEMLGFSSVRRQHVRIQHIKGFGERWGEPVRARVGALKPGFYTRMGAAVRDATRRLAERPERQRLLLVLTDGKPNDLDIYEGRYGLEDTRHAIQEARDAGLTPFCVTIDHEAHDYLPMLFGSNGYALVRQPQDLTRRLTQAWVTLAR